MPSHQDGSCATSLSCGASSGSEKIFGLVGLPGCEFGNISLMCFCFLVCSGHLPSEIEELLTGLLERQYVAYHQDIVLVLTFITSSAWGLCLFWQEWCFSSMVPGYESHNGKEVPVELYCGMENLCVVALVFIHSSVLMVYKDLKLFLWSFELSWLTATNCIVFQIMPLYLSHWPLSWGLYGVVLLVTTPCSHLNCDIKVVP